MEPFPRYVHPLPAISLTTEQSWRASNQSQVSLTTTSASSVTMVQNDSALITQEWMFGETEDSVILPLILSIIVLWCWVGHLLVMAAMLTGGRSDGFHLMLVNVSLSDLVFVTVCAPVAIVNHATYGALTDTPALALCKVVHFILFLCVYVSIYTTVVICVFRCFGEFMSDKGKTVSYLSPGNALLSCVVIWVAFVLSHIHFLLQRDSGIFQEPFICVHSNGLMSPDKLRTLWLTFLSCGFLLPLLAVTVLSILTMLRNSNHDDSALNPLHDRSPSPRDLYSECIIQHSSHITEFVPPQHSSPTSSQRSSEYSPMNSQARTRRQRSTVVLTVIIARILCWTPLQIFILLDVFGDSHNSELLYKKAEMLSVCFTFVACCINPVIFYAISHEIKNGVREIVTRLGCVGCEPVHYEDQGSDMNETIMSIISESSNHINYQV